MDHAEAAIRSGGYSAFSFRTVADALQIKSASVHYHFAGKDDLVKAVVDRYSDRFFQAIGQADASKALQKYVSTFEAALSDSCQGCLCGVLAGEGGLLAEPIRQALVKFCERNLNWLTQAFAQCGFTPAESSERARIAFSAMQGAIAFASLDADAKMLRQVSKSVLELTKAY